MSRYYFNQWNTPTSPKEVKGGIKAKVQGSRSTPYKVSIKLNIFSESD